MKGYLLMDAQYAFNTIHHTDIASLCFLLIVWVVLFSLVNEVTKYTLAAFGTYLT